MYSIIRIANNLNIILNRYNRKFYNWFLLQFFPNTYLLNILNKFDKLTINNCFLCFIQSPANRQLDNNLRKVMLRIFLIQGMPFYYLSVYSNDTFKKYKYSIAIPKVFNLPEFQMYVPYIYTFNQNNFKQYKIKDIRNLNKYIFQIVLMEDYND